MIVIAILSNWAFDSNWDSDSYNDSDRNKDNTTSLHIRALISPNSFTALQLKTQTPTLILLEVGATDLSSAERLEPKWCGVSDRCFLLLHGSPVPPRLRPKSCRVSIEPVEP